jgi:hypothetical protein
VGLELYALYCVNGMQSQPSQYCDMDTNDGICETLQWVDFVKRTPFGAGVFMWHESYVGQRIGYGYT